MDTMPDFTWNKYNSLYTHMCNNPHFMAFDLNLIIRLLYININYNYFTFADLVFQQIDGTAMGAAFSPTIANIFLGWWP